MTHETEKIFALIEDAPPPPGLEQAVLKRLAAARRHGALRRIILFATGALISLAGLSWALIEAKNGFSQSGFFRYFSLLFSDLESVMAYWKNFALSLLETLPVISLTLTFGALTVFLECLRRLAIEIKRLSPRLFNQSLT